MKKIMITVLFLAAVTAIPNAFAEAPANKVPSKTVKVEKPGIIKIINSYIVNRILDFTDTFSVDLSLGPQIGFTARATRFLGLAANVGGAASINKDFNRQYGWALNQGWDAQFLSFQNENSERTFAGGTLQNYWIFDPPMMPSQMEQTYNPRTGIRDYWVLELAGSCIFGLRGALHPLQIWDFWAGFIGFDPAGDDMKPSAD